MLKQQKSIYGNSPRTILFDYSNMSFDMSIQIVPIVSLEWTFGHYHVINHNLPAIRLPPIPINRELYILASILSSFEAFAVLYYGLFKPRKRLPEIIHVIGFFSTAYILSPIVYPHGVVFVLNAVTCFF